MSIPVKHIDLLRGFVANTSYPAWARDLVCLAAISGGSLSEADRLLIWEEKEKGLVVPSQMLPTGLGAPYPKVELMKLTHHQGVNAIAKDQEIIFCDEGITLLFGQNRSGKSGYFRILNQLASGQVAYPIHPHLYAAIPDPLSVSIEYKVDGVDQPVFNWDGVTACPALLKHIRCFDSNYASRFLEQRDGNTYLFESYNLKVFRAVYEMLCYLKDDLKLTIDNECETALRNLCTISYRDTLVHSLRVAFREELDKLGMGTLQVDLTADDLMDENSKIAIKIVNNLDIDNVLSEAELKAVSLALFLAECELMVVKQPIIFDDPVNSLDAVIIQKFADRLRDMHCEVVVFTHNILLMEALTDERHFKVYGNPSVDRSIATTTKKRVLVYDVLINSRNVGFIAGRDERKTLFYLNSAQTSISTAAPLSNLNGIVSDLRMAVEWAIDEVVFRSLAPHRFKGSEQNDWGRMRDMATGGAQNVDDLKTNYNALSAMGAHLGYSSYAVTPTPTALQAIHDDILRIYNSI